MMSRYEDYAERAAHCRGMAERHQGLAIAAEWKFLADCWAGMSAKAAEDELGAICRPWQGQRQRVAA